MNLSFIGVDQSLTNTAIVHLHINYKNDVYYKYYQEFKKEFKNLLVALNIKPNEYQSLMKKQTLKDMNFTKALLSSHYKDREQLIIKSIYDKLVKIQLKMREEFKELQTFVENIDGKTKFVDTRKYFIIGYTLLSSKNKGNKRLKEYKDEYTKFIQETKSKNTLALIGLEGYSYNSTVTRSLFELGELTGLLKVVNFEEGIENMIIPPSLLKKVIADKGNAKKDIIKEKLIALFKLRFDYKKDDDLYDAFSIALFSYLLPFWNIDTVLLKVKLN